MRLFEPITIRGMTLKNRIIMAPMQMNVGYRSRRGIAYYMARANGGVGAIACGGLPVEVLISDEAWGQPGGASRFVEGLRVLIDAVHQTGAKIGWQFAHGNYFPAAINIEDTRGKPVAPSEFIEPDPPRHPWTKPGMKLAALTIGEIEDLFSRFARGAAAVKQAGFDFVAFHGSHGYLVCQFFSPIDNRRTDKYGGSLKGRMRFGIESVMAIRAAVGKDFPIFYRLGAQEETPGGIILADAVEFAVELEKAGVDIMDVSVADYLTRGLPILPFYWYPRGTYVHMAEAVKRRVNIPVVTVGRINTPELAESILAQGKADLINIGRQLIADPQWAEKVAGGRVEDIRPCLSCNTCEETAVHKAGFSCSVNPAAGREFEFKVESAPKPKKVVVIGGGPAGMEAALIAAQRNHQVTLYEKAERLGGQLLLAALPPNKEVIADFNRYLQRQLNKAGVTVKTGSPVTADSVLKLNPDAVVIATGAEPIIPEIPGIRGQNVVTAEDALLSRCPLGKAVVVVGGGLVGCEVALFLAEKGHRVTIAEMLDTIGADIGELTRIFVLRRLTQAGIGMQTRAKVEGITLRGVVVSRDGGKHTVKADSVVLAVGMKPARQLYQELQGSVSALYTAGDCVEPRKIVGAIEDGARIGREI